MLGKGLAKGNTIQAYWDKSNPTFPAHFLIYPNSLVIHKQLLFAFTGKTKQVGTVQKANRWIYRRQSCSRGTLWISGSCCSASWCWKQWLVKRWKHTPEATRPARPFLCSAFARETHESSRLSMLLDASYLKINHNN